MDHKSKRNSRIETGNHQKGMISSPEDLKKIQEEIKSINSIIEETNKELDLKKKELEEKYGLKLNINRIEKFGFDTTLILEIKDKKSGQLKERIIRDSKGDHREKFNLEEKKDECNNK